MPIHNHANHLSFESIGGEIIDHVPAMVYRIVVPPTGPILVKDRPKFDLPDRIFGEAGDYGDIIYEDYASSTAPVGAVLMGIKGSGKTLTGEVVANRVIASGRPVLLIDEPHSPALLKHMIQICGPCMVMFDEFGKVYNSAQRQDFLPLLSDSSIRNVLFLVTANQDREMDEYMKDRPGRFKYWIEYETISMRVVDEYCTYLGADAQVRELITSYAEHMKVTFDIVRFVAKEIMKISDRAQLDRRIAMLNVPDLPKASYEIIQITRDGEVYTGRAVADIADNVIELNLTNESFETDRVAVFTYDQTKGTVLRDQEHGTLLRMDAGNGLTVVMSRKYGSKNSTVRIAKPKEESEDDPK